MKRIGSRPPAERQQLAILIGERRIRTRVKQLARQLSTDYRGTVPVFIGILNGSFVFLADLIREVPLECEVDFVKVSRYRGLSTRPGAMSVRFGLTHALRGRHVVVVEDVVDSGSSLERVRRMISRRNPATVRCVALLYKERLNSPSVIPEYVGFIIPKDFVAGYGLDLGLRMRNKKSIYRLVRRRR